MAPAEFFQEKGQAMRTRGRLLLRAALLLMLLPRGAFAQQGALETPAAWAKDRSLYPGDVLALEIEGRAYSAAVLAEKFKDFEIVELTEKPGGIALSVRTFEVGEHVVRLGDQEIVIDVRSTLDDIEQEALFEGDTGVLPPGFRFPWREAFYAMAGLFTLSGGFALWQAFRGRSKKISPLARFLRRCGALSGEEDAYFVRLTFYFKEYLGSLTHSRIIGKTSAEIIAGLQGIQALQTMLPESKAWLEACDRYKFAGVSVGGEEKRVHYEQLLGLAQRIDTLMMDTQKEGAA